MARALAALLVTLALLAQASVLTVRPPAVVVARTLAGQVVALAVGVTITFPFAVGPPKLCRALCQQTGKWSVVINVARHS